MRRVIAVGVVIVTLVYPILVYWGLNRWDRRIVAILLVVLALMRVLYSREAVWLVALAGTLGLATATWVGGSLLPLQLYPVLVNGALLGVFAVSLWRPPTVVERMARLREPAMSPAAVAYTRRVTLVWCGFFVLNGSLSLATSVWASPRLWALYNGLVAYVLMGVLFAMEYWVRQRVRRRGAHE